MVLLSGKFLFELVLKVIFWAKHGSEDGMINHGYHGNDASADSNIVVFVHPPQVTYLHTKNKGGGGVRFFHFSTFHHFLREQSLIVSFSTPSFWNT